MFTSSGADLSQSSVTSSVTNVTYGDNIGIAVNWTGTSPVGALDIQVSNDGSTWVSLDFGSSIAISGNSGNALININQLPYAQIRAVYTKTSGTGTLYASLTAKQTGG
jgi:hypothetical protein